MTKYCDICQLHLFCNIVKLQYIDTETYDTHRMLHDMYLTLTELKLVSKFNGKHIPLHPTLYTNVFPNTITWSFSLISFYNALIVELQEAIRLDVYILPDNSTLSTPFSQTSTLQILRRKSGVVFKFLSEEKTRVLLLLNYNSSLNLSLLNIETEADIN